MTEQNFGDFCAIYLLSTQEVNLKDIEKIPELAQLFNHCQAHEKMVALQSGIHSQLIYPRLKRENSNISKEDLSLPPEEKSISPKVVH